MDAGWYPDPTGRHESRYFDGDSWTDQVLDSQVARPAPGGPPRTNRLAIATFLLGLLGGWLAFIIGPISLSQIRRSGGAERGRGLAHAGMITAGLWTLIWIVILLSVFGAFGDGGSVARINKDDLISWEWIFGYTNDRGRVVDGHTDDIWAATVEHLQLTGIALGVGLVLSIVLAAVALRWRRTYSPIAGFAGVLYAIPSLALFAILFPITGLTVLTAEIGLVGYTLLILIRNIVAGVDGVPDAVKEAADGMGYRPLRRFFSVDLRLATPAIVAGIRIASVTTVGLVTVTFVIGFGGYGGLINDGLSRDFNTPVVVGAGLSIVMALVLDLVLVVVERFLTPWTRAVR